MNPSTGSIGKWAAVIGVVTAVLLLLTDGNIGLTWDEPAYIAASGSYNGWFHRLVFGPHGVLNQKVVDPAWSTNNEHPPVDKMVSGWVWVAARNVFNDLLAHRLANILLVSLTVALLFQIMALELGQIAGWATVAALLTMPRFFFHAHLAALDVPAACMIVIVTYVFWRTKESARFRHTLLLGIVSGLAIATKVNAVFILPTLFLWALIFRSKSYILIRLVLAALIGVTLFVGIWPWLYYDTVNRLREYITFFIVSKERVAQYFLGRTLLPPPWNFPFVMTWAVIPLGTTILYFLGILRSVFRRRDRAFCAMLALNALVPLIILATGKSLAYDDDRLFMPVFPFLAALAGAGFSWMAYLLRVFFQRVRHPMFATLLSAAAAVLFLITPILGIVTFYPHLLSYYSESVGGLPGATKLGLETTYWSESYREAVDYINKNAQPGDSVWVEPATYDILVYYQFHNVLRDDVSIAITYDTNPQTVFGTGVPFHKVAVSYTQATFVIIQYHQSYLYDSNGQPGDVAKWMSNLKPVYRVERQGVPIMDIFRNP
ncbi:MAG: glycosyltransferase family 39 protein [Anaerolineales bacterium]